MDKIVSFDLWYEYLNSRKIHYLEYFEKYCFIDKSPENYKIIDIIIKTLNINLFDLSQISYLGLLFLDKFIITNIIHILKISQYFETDIDTDDDTNNDTNSGDINNKITIFLEFVINLIISIELILNVQFLVLLNYLYDLYDDNYFYFCINLPNMSNDIFKYRNIIHDIRKNIKSSSWLLISFKLIRNFFQIFNLDTDINIIKSHNNIHSKFKCQLSKINNIFDDWILKIDILKNTQISQELEHEQNINLNNKNNMVYKICVELIINIVDCLMEMLGDVFNELVSLLTIKYPTEKDKLNSICLTIKLFIDIEKQKIIDKLVSY